MGNYTNKNLVLNEMVVFETKYHWTYYANIWSLISLGLYPYLHHKFSEFVVTNKRVIIKRGIFHLNAFEIPVSRIETVHIHQNFLGRVFGFGSILIVGTGGSQVEIEHINQPLSFRNSFVEIM